MTHRCTDSIWLQCADDTLRLVLPVGQVAGLCFQNDLPCSLRDRSLFCWIPANSNIGLLLESSVHRCNLSCSGLHDQQPSEVVLC